jgi:hypothetical protein
VQDYFIPGKKLDIVDVQGLQINTKFNPVIDVPAQMADVFKSQELNQVICPVISDSLQHIKLLVRLTSTKDWLILPHRLRQTQMIMNEISSPLLKGLSQFKNLCK